MFGVQEGKKRMVQKTVIEQIISKISQDIDLRN